MVTGTSRAYNIDVGGGKVEKRCWNRRTRIEKCLTCWYLFTAVILILFVIFYFLQVTGVYSLPGIDSLKTKNFECETQRCEEKGKLMKSYMNSSVKPCDDFYNYVCGNYTPENREYSSVFSDQVKSIDQVLKDLLDASPTSGISTAAKNARRFHSSCKGVSPNRKKNLEEVLNFMKDENFILYTKSSWNGANYDITNDIIKLLALSQQSVFQFTIDINPENSSRFIPMVKTCQSTFNVDIVEKQNQENQTSSTNPPKVNTNETEKNLTQPKNPVNATETTSNGFNETLNNNFTLERIYKDHQAIELSEKLKKIENFIVNIYFKEENLTDGTVKDMKDFITQLYHIRPPITHCMSPTLYFNSLRDKTIRALKTEIPEIDWMRMFMAATGHEPDVDEVLKVNHVDFLLQLNELISNTEPRIIHNCLIALLYVDKFHDIISEEDPTRRNEMCLELTKSFFGDELSAMCTKTKQEVEFEKLKKEIETIENYIKRPIIDRISGLNWMDQPTINKTMEKVMNIKSTLLAPSYTFYENEYEDDEMTLDVIENLIKRLKIAAKRRYALYETGVDPSKVTWNHVINAISGGYTYSPNFNSLDVPMAFLVPPNYDTDLPRYINFATIGLAIAHEIGHSFTGLGLNFNTEGLPEKLMSNASEKEARRKEGCFIKQYSKMGRSITYQDLKDYKTHVNGNQTLNENIADNIALQFAYEAYKDWLMDEANKKDLVDGQEKIFPQFSSKSPDELFFIAAAQGFCSKETPAQYLVKTYASLYTTNKERVNGFMMNSLEFADSFKCERGSNMNPNRKCSYI